MSKTKSLKQKTNSTNIFKYQNKNEYTKVPKIKNKK